MRYLRKRKSMKRIQTNFHSASALQALFSQNKFTLIILIIKCVLIQPNHISWFSLFWIKQNFAFRKIQCSRIITVLFDARDCSNTAAGMLSRRNAFRFATEKLSSMLISNCFNYSFFTLQTYWVQKFRILRVIKETLRYKVWTVLPKSEFGTHIRMSLSLIFIYTKLMCTVCTAHTSQVTCSLWLSFDFWCFARFDITKFFYP